MKTQYLSLILSFSFAAFAADPAPQPAAAPPPAAPPKRSAADLEKLVAPIALYPDPLIATMLPASVYPLEIVQAARFVTDTNNLAKLDEQPWDDNVKAVARVPAVIQKMNGDLTWTMELGDAFLAQDKDVMDAIQSMRGKAQKAGTLQTTPQQVVVVTNMIVEKTVEQKVVVVTNTIVQIQPSSSSVVYVPTYNPYTVYYPPPAYVYNPYAPLVTFAAGMAVGAAIANNNCNWNNGGCYHGSGNVNVNVNNNNNVNVNRNNSANSSRSTSAGQTGAAGGQQKWQPDQSRMAKSGSPTASTSARSAEARGYGSGGAGPSTGSAGARPSTGTASARPSTGTAAARPSTGTATARPSTGSAGAGTTSTWGGSANRSTPSPSTSQSRSTSASRPSSSGSAFGGSSSGASASASSSRGSSSRSSSSGFSGGGGGGGRSGGGGGGGGGGRSGGGGGGGGRR